MTDPDAQLPGPFQPDYSLEEARPNWGDSRFSLASLVVGWTLCCVLLATLRQATPTFWDTLVTLSLVMLALLAMCAVILIASLVFIGAVLTVLFATVAVVRACAGVLTELGASELAAARQE